MSQKDNKIIFTTEDNEEVEFTIIEQTRVNGINYLLVTDAFDEEEADAYILKDISDESEEEAIYDMVEDDNELQAVGKIFEELLEDIDIY